MVIVPDIVGLSEEESISVLKKSNLEYILISSRSSDFPMDIIYKQEPEANSLVKKNRVIRIYLNCEVAQTIPNLVGMNVDQLGEFLKKNDKIKINRIDYQKTKGTENIILATYPKAGTNLKYEEGLSILLSSKLAYDQNLMIDIVDLDIADALKLLRKNGYNNITVSEIESLDEKEGIVIAQEPVATKSILKSDKITIYVASHNVNKKEEKNSKKEEENKLDALFNEIEEGILNEN